ncbi:MAG: hypothetical protein COV07_01105 [Candidatus Vogelbacteria bacterium CG10_big_fil_rev_8_21_14_0_10_45_14]|uniref:LTD domain-containing protein n=1 Tax=Candidatus Vogelbacteria bacterium CG10_big_fil_rev_8_21_14_0_10_45_14 TaxID=1975042 RepID=A0A2H0RKI9_9BACT|nr:MAG: hypothetical protein COV07_01105 [Candidatus Vogelbacteria bacterium CG10_big_fil_rev_8_21_14_0_10_45_14]
MADAPAPSPASVAFTFLVVMAVFFVAWMWSGGPDDPRSKTGILLEPPPPLGTGEVYGELPDIIKIAKNSLPSRYAWGTSISVDNNSGVPTISLAPTATSSALTITGWKMVNSRGMVATIPKATRSFMQGVINSTEDVIVERREEVIVSDTTSPVGVSFKVDRCSGFLEEFQDFNPPLSLSCPSPVELVRARGANPPDASCASYVENLPSCQIGLNSGYSSLSQSCRGYVADTISQQSCVEKFGGRFDFFVPEWRVYLGSPGFFNPASDTIYIFDQDGALVGTSSW